MEQQRTQRKLTTILAADVEGYTRLMRANEEATLKTLTEYRDVVDGLIARHDGRVFSTGGDSVLAEFGSAVEAVRCAISCQEEISSRNAELADDRKLMFRIGINVGDVMVRDGDLLGDGVNVAARLEGLAEPGGVCISGSVFEQIKHKLSLGFEDMGQQEVKNIAEPVSAYRLVPDQVSVAATAAAKSSRVRHWWIPAMATAVVLVIAAGGLAIWRPWAPDVEPASIERMAFTLPDKPSIAVLPFENLSGDPKQDFFVDGFTENIITALARVPKLFVIARNSTFTYKSKPVKVQVVAEELGVKYVLEGSVQRSGETIRITAQLIDALTGGHVWAERYDRDMQDLFALQDDITLNILKALQVVLTEGDIGAVRPTNDSRSLDAYLLYWQAVEHYRRFNREDNERARQLAMRANELDPQFAQAAALVGWSHQMDGRFGWSDSRAKSYGRGAEIAGRALQLDPEHPSVQALLSNVYLSQRKFEDAIAAGRKSIALAPSVSVFHANTAVATYYAGNFEETVTLTKDAMRLHPYYPAWYDYRIGVAYRMLGQYDEAVTALTANKGRRAKPNMLALTALAATYSMMGRLADGRAGVKETLKLHPNASVQAVAKMHYFKDAAHLERILDALRKVGLPE